MSLLMSITVAVLFGAGIFLLSGRDLKGVVMGVFLLGHAANLAIVTTGGSPIGRTPAILPEYGLLSGDEADPLPQALVLTAIVIGFAMQAFLLTVLVVTWRRAGSIRVDVLRDMPKDEYGPLESERRGAS